MSRPRRSSFHEPSLVPLADMLSNTVGIIVFILIFTVLTAGAAIVGKTLPMERSTSAERVTQICRGNRVLPLDVDGLSSKYIATLEADPPGDLVSLLERMDKLKVQDAYCTMTAQLFFESDTPQEVLCFNPKDGVGETVEGLKQAESHFGQVLRNRKPHKHFIYFFVYPDSIEAFIAARALAQTRGYKIGWRPCADNEELVFSSDGREAKVQN